jgi:phage terminase Nu1 subunit (DNA packaging protein)
MTAATLDGQVLPGLGSTPLDEVFRALALAHIGGLDLRSAIDAAVMTFKGIEPTEAVHLAEADAHDPRLKHAAAMAAELISHLRATQITEAPASTPTPTMRDVRQGDVIRLGNRIITVRLIDFGTVAYIQPRRGDEIRVALDAPVEIHRRVSTGEGTAEQRDTYADAEYAAERADYDDELAEVDA